MPVGQRPTIEPCVNLTKLVCVEIDDARGVSAAGLSTSGEPSVLTPAVYQTRLLRAPYDASSFGRLRA